MAEVRPPKQVDPHGHTPVLLSAILAQFDFLGTAAPKPQKPQDRVVKLVDGTFGGGGYTHALLQTGAHVVAFDRDAEAIQRGQALLQKYPQTLTLVHAPFTAMAHHLHAMGWDEVDGIALDLGLSSYQLDEPARGFSYQTEGPLDMRMGQQEGVLTAAQVLNSSSEKDLADIFYYYGEEPRSRPFARAIIERRTANPFVTTRDFFDLIDGFFKAPKKNKATGKVRRHPAQRLFQALRMAVNAEEEQLTDVIPQAASLLAAGGKLCIVTFHSLEDRLVKQAFKKIAAETLDNVGRKIGEADFTLPVRKIMASDAEIEENIRARSGILRVLQKRQGVAA